MDPNERESLLADLRSSRSALLAAVSGVPEDRVARSPAPGCWSVLECVEHVALVEKHLLTRITSSRHSDVSTANPQREAFLAARVLDRTKKIQAPELAIPTGRYPTLSAALQAFLESRDCTIQFVEQCTSDLRSELTTHPLIGEANCHEVLVMMAAHPHRHAKQIEEVKAALGPSLTTHNS
jgi:hypothetical protein